MKGMLRLVLVAAALGSTAVGSVQAATLLLNTQHTPITKYKGPTQACTLIKTNTGWHNPCAKVTIPFFG
ncbi:hypothetical protein [Azospirillum brasilense]|uniref:hypothetical protein n=1 Tax=Azospirillum brasilense TaxID=192 RepID=UPI000E691D36|nr:hypothetical protein [Azospirillum brasilense]NUB25194.1 hypothetical protein [Azospirillum brasilense]NUB32924.1 hypothetical protein [Azospirillum brasilense]RIW02330.1 hypothetical protein D2T81_16100 [Azospirillum brasilense]